VIFTCRETILSRVQCGDPNALSSASVGVDTCRCGAANAPRASHTESDVNRLLITLCTFVLGSVGWYIGESVGMFTAFALSMVGTGVGIYAGRRLAQHWGG